MKVLLRCSLWLLLFSQSALAAGLLEQPCPYVLIRQDIRSALESVAGLTGVRFDISERVSGQTQQPFTAQTLGGFLRQLSQQSELYWFAREGTVYIDRAGSSTGHISTSGYSSAAVEQLLQQYRAYEGNFSVHYRADQRQIDVSGPVQLEQQLKTALNELPAGGSHSAVRVFRGSDQGLTRF